MICVHPATGRADPSRPPDDVMLSGGTSGGARKSSVRALRKTLRSSKEHSVADFRTRKLWGEARGTFSVAQGGEARRSTSVRVRLRPTQT
jgi:hypothetical protein